MKPDCSRARKLIKPNSVLVIPLRHMFVEHNNYIWWCKLVGVGGTSTPRHSRMPLQVNMALDVTAFKYKKVQCNFKNNLCINTPFQQYCEISLKDGVRGISIGGVLGLFIYHTDLLQTVLFYVFCTGNYFWMLLFPVLCTGATLLSVHPPSPSLTNK